METHKFEVLYDFLDRAVKSRNYPENTAISIRTALNLFKKELNDNEINSIGEFRKNLNQIYNSVFSKNKNFNAGSLAVYKSRVLRVLNDYEKYGQDATKMANWTVKISSPRAKKITTGVNKNLQAKIEDSNSFHSFDFTGGVKLLIPKNSTTTDAIMDGVLSGIKTELKNFSEKYCKKDDLSEEINKNDE